MGLAFVLFYNILLRLSQTKFGRLLRNRYLLACRSLRNKVFLVCRLYLLVYQNKANNKSGLKVNNFKDKQKITNYKKKTRCLLINNHKYLPSQYTSQCWAQVSSLNGKSQAVVPTRPQCGSGTAHTLLNFLAGYVGWFPVFFCTVQFVEIFKSNFSH